MKGLVVGLLLLGGGLVLGDRLAASAAEGVLEDAVRAELPGARVEAALRAPFLPQFARGRYDEVLLEVSGPLPGVRVTRGTVALRGAQVPPSAALSGAVEQVPVDAVSVRATVPYEELTRLAGDGLTVSSAGQGLVRVTGEVEVLGRSLSAAAVGSLAVEGGDLRVRPQRFETGSGLADGLLERVAGDRFDVTVDPGTLPFGLEPTGVGAGSAGVTVSADAGPTVLRTGSPPAAAALPSA